MLRIVWGVIVIGCGLVLVADSLFTLALRRQLGPLLDFAPVHPFAILVIGVCACALGSILVYCGDDDRLRRIEAAVNNSTIPPVDEKGPSLRF